jgi:hypothetical protein
VIFGGGLVFYYTAVTDVTEEVTLSVAGFALSLFRDPLRFGYLKYVIKLEANPVIRVPRIVELKIRVL